MCTHPAYTGQPTKCGKPVSNLLIREPAGVSSIQATSCENVDHKAIEEVYSKRSCLVCCTRSFPNEQQVTNVNQKRRWTDRWCLKMTVSRAKMMPTMRPRSTSSNTVARKDTSHTDCCTHTHTHTCTRAKTHTHPHTCKNTHRGILY